MLKLRMVAKLVPHGKTVEATAMKRTRVTCFPLSCATSVSRSSKGLRTILCRSVSRRRDRKEGTDEESKTAILAIHRLELIVID